MALDWLPTYPTVSARPQRQGFWIEVQNILPIPRDPPPTPWTIPAVYPDALHRPARLGMYPFLAQWPMVPVADLRWLPSYPSQLRLAPRVVGTQPFLALELGSLFAIPQFASWRPTYPDQLRRAPRVAAGEGRWVVDPGTLLTSAPCVEWRDGTLIRSMFLEMDLGRSQFTAEAVTHSQFTAEVLC